MIIEWQTVLVAGTTATSLEKKIERSDLVIVNCGCNDLSVRTIWGNCGICIYYWGLTEIHSKVGNVASTSLELPPFSILKTFPLIDVLYHCWV